MFVLSGSLRVTAGADTVTLGRGGVLFLEDTTGPGHATTALEDLVMAVVRL
jgi:hypothetical protein